MLSSAHTQRLRARTASALSVLYYPAATSRGRGRARSGFPRCRAIPPQAGKRGVRISAYFPQPAYYHCLYSRTRHPHDTYNTYTQRPRSFFPPHIGAERDFAAARKLLSAPTTTRTGGGRLWRGSTRNARAERRGHVIPSESQSAARSAHASA